MPDIMGILNVTPDSFSDGGCYLNHQNALAQAQQMQAEGANIIDVGGESSRPNAIKVSLDEELNRVIPVIEALSDCLDLPISIDTTKPEVMREALKAGATMINDITALGHPDALSLVAQSKVKVCLMHRQGTPQTMQKNPHYDNVVVEVIDFFKQKINQCQIAGINKNQLIIDPGFGFGKTFKHNWQLLRQLSQLSQFNLPILVGLSKKSMIDTLLGGNTKPNQRVIASISAALLAVNQGAHIIRTHNVGQTKEALMVWYHNEF